MNLLFLLRAERFSPFADWRDAAVGIHSPAKTQLHAFVHQKCPFDFELPFLVENLPPKVALRSDMNLVFQGFLDRLSQAGRTFDARFDARLVDLCIRQPRSEQQIQNKKTACFHGFSSMEKFIGFASCKAGD
jgi:hypothetical protein